MKTAVVVSERRLRLLLRLRLALRLLLQLRSVQGPKPVRVPPLDQGLPSGSRVGDLDAPQRLKKDCAIVDARGSQLAAGFAAVPLRTQLRSRVASGAGVEAERMGGALNH